MNEAAPVSARERANREQRAASDPRVSAFVTASAGSGKTKVLTDRLLRLMLAGADPGRIQCLTFTKAAAAEMALRLQRTLGAWVTMDDAPLDAALAALDVAASASVRDHARALFARVLDLPGGMRIGTIHAFCEQLLRRFPLEARLSPHFRLIEDSDATLALREAREDMLAGAHTTARRAELERLAGIVSLQRFGELVDRLRASPDRLASVRQLGAEGVVAALDRVLRADRRGPEAAVVWPDADLRAAAAVLAREGSPAAARKGQELCDWLARPPEDRAAAWKVWRDQFFAAEGKPLAESRLVNDALRKKRPDLLAPFLAEQARIAIVEDGWRAAAAVDASAALLNLAAPVAAAYAARKDGAGQLDFDDLIARTSGLLVDPGAAWVLYKLDGGLDHLLLDEVQDTAPAQWTIAGALTGEFFAGAGARDIVAGPPRTVFAVGDRKQSIYSFQGADPDAFDYWRGELERRVAHGAAAWRAVTVDVSFRSTSPVLALVDAVFAAPDAAAGVVDPRAGGGDLTHHSDRAGHAGRVELWPLVPVPEREFAQPWRVPERNLSEISADRRLAEALADWIARETDGSTLLESRARPLTPGDVLILVRRRGAFAHSMVRALKARGVPVAGIDRMVLTDQPAVADLLSLADALLLPTDDLALACFLTSPLGGVTDDELMALAMERAGSLWDALRERAAERPSWKAAEAFFAALLRRVDYASPHALLCEALGPLGGRARLLARLGPEAAEPVDELLAAALADGRAHPPSLQGFLHRLRAAGAEVKREAEGAGGLVRLMTAHGAKGLQAPLVILPDTTATPKDDGPLDWARDVSSGIDVPVWAPRKEFRCAATERLREAARRRRMEEHNRLLYVALTRAEDRLVVCGWTSRTAPADDCWYELVRRGFDRLPTEFEPLRAEPPWDGQVRVHAAPQRLPPSRQGAASPAAPPPPLPPWAGAAPDWRAAPAPPEPPRPQPLAPSRPEGAALGPVPAAASPLGGGPAGSGRFRRGQLIHTLLQHLPERPRADRDAAARRWLARPGQALPPDDVEAIVSEIASVLDHPALTPLFGPEGRAEVPLTGVIDGSVVSGMVDRVAILPDRVLVADYKANRAPPSDPAGVPVLYLRQMAAYRAILRSVCPGRPVLCWLVWTVGPVVTELSDSALDAHAPGVG